MKKTIAYILIILLVLATATSVVADKTFEQRKVSKELSTEEQEVRVSMVNSELITKADRINEDSTEKREIRTSIVDSESINKIKTVDTKEKTPRKVREVLEMEEKSDPLVCTDSDNGNDLETQGTTSGRYGNIAGESTFNDYCISGGPYNGDVVEYSCFQNTEWIQFQRHSCPTGTECDSGACVPEPQPACTPVQITNDVSSDSEAFVYENHIVWQKEEPHPSYEVEIFMYDIDTGITTQLTNNTNLDIEPVIYDDKILWTSRTDLQIDPNFHIFMSVYDINTGTTSQILDSPPDYDEIWPDMYEDYVVFTGFGNYSAPDYPEVYLYDLNTDTITQIGDNTLLNITHENYFPKIYGDYIVWSANYNDSGSEIFMHNLNTGTNSQLTNNPDWSSYYPNIYGDYIVWTQKQGSFEDSENIIMLYEISTGTTTQISPSNDGLYDGTPEIHGNYVVWPTSSTYNGETNLVLYNLATGTSTEIITDGYDNTRPNLHDDYLVWQKSVVTGHDDDEIYFLDLSTC